MLHYVPGITMALVRDRVLRARAVGKASRPRPLPVMHPYTYAENSAVNLVDPSGLTPRPSGAGACLRDRYAKYARAGGMSYQKACERANKECCSHAILAAQAAAECLVSKAAVLP
jgi:hypothetical protein